VRHPNETVFHVYTKEFTPEIADYRLKKQRELRAIDFIHALLQITEPKDMEMPANQKCDLIISRGRTGPRKFVRDLRNVYRYELDQWFSTCLNKKNRVKRYYQRECERLREQAKARYARRTLVEREYQRLVNRERYQYEKLRDDLIELGCGEMLLPWGQRYNNRYPWK
jgi:hypothetical protein